MEGSRELCEPTNMNLPDETRGTHERVQTMRGSE